MGILASGIGILACVTKLCPEMTYMYVVHRSRKQPHTTDLYLVLRTTGQVTKQGIGLLANPTT